MDDANKIDKSYLKVRITQIEWSIPIITLLMIITGLVVQFIVSREDVSRFTRYAAVVPFGVAALTATYLLGHSFISNHWKKALFAVIGVSVWIIMFNPQVNGTYGLIKSIIILFCPIMALTVFHFSNKGYRGILLCEAFYVILAVICIVANATLGLFMITAVFITIMVVAIAKDCFHVEKRIASSMLILPVLVTMFLAHPLLRNFEGVWKVLWNPGYDPRGEGFQGIVVRQIISHSNVWGPARVLDGQFANRSIEKELLGGWNNDFLLTYLVGKYGYIVGLLIVALFAVFVWRLFAAVLRQKDMLGLLLSLSAAIPIALEGFLFIAANSWLAVSPSAPLPIISTRGVSFMVTMVLIGLVVSEQQEKLI